MLKEGLECGDLFVLVNFNHHGHRKTSILNFMEPFYYKQPVTTVGIGFSVSFSKCSNFYLPWNRHTVEGTYLQIVSVIQNTLAKWGFEMAKVAIESMFDSPIQQPGQNMNIIKYG